MITPKLVGPVRFRLPLPYISALKTLIASTVNTTLTVPVIRVRLPTEKSEFWRGSPVSVPRLDVESWLMRTRRNALYAAAGSANMLMPEPPVAGLPVVPIPFEPATPVNRFYVGSEPAADEAFLVGFADRFAGRIGSSRWISRTSSAGGTHSASPSGTPLSPR